MPQYDRLTGPAESGLSITMDSALSYNYTNESEFRNYEAAIFTNHNGLIQSFAAEFERLWLLCTPAESPVQPPSDSETTGPSQDTD